MIAFLMMNVLYLMQFLLHLGALKLYCYVHEFKICLLGSNILFEHGCTNLTSLLQCFWSLLQCLEI